ncbi:hypothetical protein BDZ45DRAFT_360133 [Acephala macrosclerotiorum]|nr:hypothetical protein BDZ45DRAFT_360133 [Acephala macrosclerotiorum]
MLVCRCGESTRFTGAFAKSRRKCVASSDQETHAPSLSPVSQSTSLNVVLCIPSLRTPIPDAYTRLTLMPRYLQTALPFSSSRLPLILIVSLYISLPSIFTSRSLGTRTARSFSRFRSFTCIRNLQMS